MHLRDIGKSLRNEKQMLINGALLLVLAAALILGILRFDAVWGAMRTIFGAVSPVLCGIVIAYVLNVFVHFFEDVAFRPFKKSKNRVWQKLKRPLSVTLAYLVVLGVLAFLACFVIPGVLQSLALLGETMQKTVPAYINTAVTWINNFALENDLGFVQEFLKEFNWSSILSDVTRFTTDFVGVLVNMGANVASGVFTLVMGFIFSVYMLFGKERLTHGLRSTILAFMPDKASKKLTRVASVTNEVFYSFIRGQLTECVILGGLCYVGMSLLRLDYALLISAVVALGALIPILGAYIGAAVGVFILLLVHPIDALIFLIFLLCLQQVEGNLIYPRVVGSSMGLPPVWTMFAVLFWGAVLGIPGILIGTPTTAVCYRLLRRSVRDRLRGKGIDPNDPKLKRQSPFEDEKLETADGEQQKMDV